MMRQPFFDVLKFFAIALVVYGHVMWGFGCNAGAPFVENFRCGMNMPLFFIISGYFAARTIECHDWRKLLRRVWGYFWPLAFVSIIFAILANAFNIEGCEKGIVGYAGRRILFSAWFCWCLALCFILTFLCSAPRSKYLRLITWGCLIVFLPLLSKCWWANEVRAMLPHFCFGVYVLRRWPCWKDARIGLSCLLGFMSLVFVQGDIAANGLSWYMGKTTWSDILTSYSTILFFLGRIANGIVGSIGVMWLLQIVMKKMPILDKLSPLGTTTLWVYILHQWFLARILATGWSYPTFCSSILWTALLLIFCHCVGLVAQKITYNNR